MQQTCANPWCSQPFTVTDDDLAFIEKVSPEFNGKKELIPPPTLCPDCRMQRRLAFRNERNLYHRKCDLTGKQIISSYSPDKPFPQFHCDDWWTDQWSPTDYGCEVDFKKSFFEQLRALQIRVPRMSVITSPDAEGNNSIYVNFSGNSKNCYMTFDSDFNEDSYYTKVLKHSKNCVDCSFVRESERCYECVDCASCYGLLHSEDCSNCSESAFLKNCTGCRNCLFCCNLNQKEYHIFNRPYDREEYERLLAEYSLGSHGNVETLIREFHTFTLRMPRKATHALKTEDSSGDYLLNVRNCHQCFDSGDAEDLRYCDALYDAKDCMDTSSFGESIQLIYESGTAGLNAYNMLFCNACVLQCSDLIYCDGCRISSHCFGCVELKKNKYCILNKQYMQEEYEALVPKIIEKMRLTGEWGEFFPKELSPFGYNETVAMEHFPLTQEEAQAGGWQWHEEEEPGDRYLGATYAIPDAITDVPEDITKQILKCEVTGKPYKIIPQELKFYRDMGIPIPRKCPDQRHKERMALRNPRKLWNRECMKCGKDIQTTYAPERPEIVYCEECYLASVY